jgi:ribosomal protein S18 acetylase RimI-like enzyme
MRTLIRPCRKEDLARIAEVHKSQFLTPGTLLGQLSPALIAALYEAFLGRSIFLVYSNDGEVDGFVLGGSSRAMMPCRLSFFRKRALFCIADIMHRARLWLLAFRSFAKLIGNWFSSMAGTSQRKEFRLLSIAVAASATRKGVGKALVECFEATLPVECRTYSLNVLKTSASAIHFYEKLAFQRDGETAIAWILRKDLAAAPANLRLPSAQAPTLARATVVCFSARSPA